MIMLRNILLINLSLLFLNCNDENINYNWNLNEIDYFINETTSYVKLNLFYKIKNNSNKDIWFYDMERGNDWQFVEFEFEKNIIRRILYIYKPYEKSYKGWYGSGGYTPNYPNSYLIKPYEEIKGEINIIYPYNNILSDNDIIYQFNFIILDIDINKNLNKLNIEDINNKYSRNYFVDIIK